MAKSGQARQTPGKVGDAPSGSRQTGASDETRSKISAMHEAMHSVDSYTRGKGSKGAPHIPDTISLAPETSQTASRFVGLIEKSIKRWELVVYPALLFLFMMFGAAAFLVYELSADMRTIARGFDPNMAEHMNRLTIHMKELSGNISTMTKRIDTMSRNVEVMAQNTQVMTEKMEHLATMEQLKAEMQMMNKTMTVMTMDMGLMRHNVAGMNRSVGKPMSFINSFMPW